MTGIDHDALRQVADMYAVYRMFTAAGQLLYVGTSGNLPRRLNSHSEKRWYPQVATITLQWFPDEAAALKAELAAIRREHPLLNVAGKKRSRSAPNRPAPAVVEPVIAVSDDPRGVLVGLAEAVAAGFAPGATVQALRMDRHRSDKGELPGGLRFPEPGGLDGAQKELFWSSELAGFNAMRRTSRAA